MKILIIEDNMELSNAICSYLSGQDYICETASTYLQASEKVDLYDSTTTVFSWISDYREVRVYRF